MKCCKCNESQDLSDFKRNGRHSSYCTQCFYKYQKQRWNKNKTILVKEHGSICHDCKQEFHPACFDFHHEDPNEKDFNISKHRGMSLSRLRKEIEKCALLCANCHRLRHISDDNWDFDLKNPEPPERTKKPVNTCICGKPTKSYRARYCSPKCAINSRHLIDWPENLPELVAKSSKRAVAAQLGVSDKSVAKRLKNHH
jgi:hypothetical protein